MIDLWPLVSRIAGLTEKRSEWWLAADIVVCISYFEYDFMVLDGVQNDELVECELHERTEGIVLEF